MCARYIIYTELVRYGGFIAVISEYGSCKVPCVVTWLTAFLGETPVDADWTLCAGDGRQRPVEQNSESHQSSWDYCLYLGSTVKT